MDRSAWDARKEVSTHGIPAELRNGRLTLAGGPRPRRCLQKMEQSTLRMAPHYSPCLRKAKCLAECRSSEAWTPLPRWLLTEPYTLHRMEAKSLRSPEHTGD